MVSSAHFRPGVSDRCKGNFKCAKLDAWVGMKFAAILTSGRLSGKLDAMCFKN